MTSKPKSKFSNIFWVFFCIFFVRGSESIEKKIPPNIFKKTHFKIILSVLAAILQIGTYRALFHLVDNINKSRTATARIPMTL